ncbi:hypothetical protein J6590_012627 [Homalodisca vitripennis]|nr:hypothetical protein J6590_012627 [Homalodisca vitripennis]
MMGRSSRETRRKMLLVNPRSPGHGLQFHPRVASERVMCGNKSLSAARTRHPSPHTPRRYLHDVITEAITKA